MQNKFLQLGMVFIIGLALTACSSNAVVQNKSKTGISNQAKKQLTVINKKIISKKTVSTKKEKIIAKKVNSTKKFNVATKINRLKINKKYPVQKKPKRRYVAKKTPSYRKYTARKTPSYRKHTARKTSSYRKYTARKTPSYRKYTARKTPSYRKYTARKAPSYRKYTARKNSATIKNDAIRRASHEKYFAIKKESQRKYFANQQLARQRATSYKRYTPRKKTVYKKYVARKRSSYRRPTVRRITPNFPNASFAKALSNAAVARTRSRVRYDGRYVNIAYPWGDVPSNIGVCTDVVIRSYRRLGIDLQKAVHEDMSNGGFYDYPNIKKWNLTSPDKNIDHRRVYNLQAFFRRHGAQLPITHNPNDYKPGDLVTWMVGPSLPHIGVVVEQRSKADPRRHMIVHNIAYGPQMEDILFRFRITGHYRYNKNNRLVAPRRFNANYAANNTIKTDYKRIMRELSVTPTRKKSKSSVRKKNPRGTVNIAQLKSVSGISDADVRALLGR